MESIMQSLSESLSVKVLGVGGAGLSAIQSLKAKGLAHVSFLGIDTDLQHLRRCKGHETVLLGSGITRGLSTGSNKDLGAEVALAEGAALAKAVEGAQLLFLVGALGGGTGASVLPALAKIAAKTDALVVVFAMLPFSMEGVRKVQQAEDSLAELRTFTHALIALPNDLLFQQLDPKATVLDAFALAHQWIYRAMYSMTSILFEPGLMNLDFATLRQVFTHKGGGKTLFALGQGMGERALEQSLAELRSCPLLHVTEQSRQADNLLVQVIGGEGLSLQTINAILSFLNEYFGNGHKVCLGALIQPEFKDRIEICLVGTLDKPLPPKNLQSLRAFTPPHLPQDTRPRSKSLKKWLSLDGDQQEEFPFVSQGQVRGYFDETDRNHYDGVDLDVPTYLRLGIKIRHELSS